MKALFSLGGIIAIFGLTVASTFAQTQSTTSSSTTYIQTSKLVGKKVKSSQGEEIGTIKDVVIDRQHGLHGLHRAFNWGRRRPSCRGRRQNGSCSLVRVFAVNRS